MIKILVTLLFFGSPLYAQGQEAKYSILKKYPEDKRGFNVKTQWPSVPGASSYKLRMFRKTPTDFDTIFVSDKTFFYFKLYPWRLYRWDVQALDEQGQELSGPLKGPDIYLESSLFPKIENEAEVVGEFQDEPEEDIQAQSYVTEGGETEIVESTSSDYNPIVLDEETTEASQEEVPYAMNNESEDQSEEEEPSTVLHTKYHLGLGLGMTSLGYEQDVVNRVGLNFSSVKIPSYHFFFNGQWSSILGGIGYQSMPGTIDSNNIIVGGKDFDLTRIYIEGGYKFLEHNLLGYKQGLATFIAYRIHTIAFLYVDPTDSLYLLAPQISAISLKIKNDIEVSEKWNIPISLAYDLPISSKGDSGGFELASGQIVSALIGLNWQTWENLSLGLNLEIGNYDLEYKSNVNSDPQDGTLNYMFFNTEAQLVYSF